MNHNTIIEFDFNEKTERDNQNFYFKYAWKKVWKTWIRITSCAIVFLFIASLPIENFDTSIFYYLFKYGGICLLIFSFILVNHYFSSKKKFKIEVDKQIKKFKNTTESHFVTMDDETIEFKNQFTTVKSVWENTVYALTDDYILICPINNLYYIIHKSEVSNHEFKVMKDYLNKNSKQQK